MKDTELENLIRIKNALADKYARLSNLPRSTPRKAKWGRLAADFRHQAADLTRRRSRAKN